MGEWGVINNQLIAGTNKSMSNKAKHFMRSERQSLHNHEKIHMMPLKRKVKVKGESKLLIKMTYFP